MTDPVAPDWCWWRERQPGAGPIREEADAHFGGLALFASMDVPASSTITRHRFGWHPVQPGLIADLDEGHYFKA